MTLRKVRSGPGSLGRNQVRSSQVGTARRSKGASATVKCDGSNRSLDEVMTATAAVTRSSDRRDRQAVETVGQKFGS